MIIREIQCEDIRLFIGDISEVDPDKIDKSLLSQYRAGKLRSIKKEKARRQSAGAELTLNYALKACIGKEAPTEYYADERGKTYFRDIDAYFSLSHSGDYALCAVSDRIVGADIQKKRKVNYRLAERFFTADELERIKKNPDDAFNRIWARKEALSKAVGAGIQMGFRNIDVLNSTVTYKGIKYRLYDIEAVSGYSIAAAVKYP